MLRVNIRNLLKNKLMICKDYHIQPSEIDSMAYFEYGWLLEEINVYVKEQEERQKAEQEEYDQSRNFKMPNVNSFKMPSFSMPKL